jgi:hypothetical protein
MSSAADPQSTIASLRRQAEALADLQRRCALLREARERPHAELDAIAAAIDAGIDACLLIAERAAVADPTGTWSSAVTELERQLRRLGVLRSQVLTLYVAPAVASCGS